MPQNMVPSIFPLQQYLYTLCELRIFMCPNLPNLVWFIHALRLLSLIEGIEENIGKYRRYIADISCIGRWRHGISRRKIRGMIFRKKSPINRRFLQIIACGRGKSPINRRYFGDKSPTFWRYFAPLSSAI